MASTVSSVILLFISLREKPAILLGLCGRKVGLLLESIPGDCSLFITDVLEKERNIKIFINKKKHVTKIMNKIEIDLQRNQLLDLIIKEKKLMTIDSITT